MRAWIWTLLVLVVAVGVAVFVQDTTGSVVVVAPPYRIEVSLVFAVLALLALFVAVYVLLRLAGWSAGLVPRWRAWRMQRQLVREHQRLELGWVRMLQGQYLKARDEFLAVTDVSRDATRLTLAQLGAARTAVALNDATTAAAALEQARRGARNDTGLLLAVACTAADLLLVQGKAEQAAQWLAQVHDYGARYVHYQRLALKTNLALGQWETALRQARSLRRHHDTQGGLEQALAQAAAGYLRSANDANEAQAIWKRLKAPERLLPEVALVAAVSFAHDPAQVRHVLQDALDANLDARLLQAYARCEGPEVRPRLQRAEAWLGKHPLDANLLQTLGTLCLKGELWGPATGYLQRSLQQRPDPRTHALLGTLYDHLGQPAEASRHWRLATALEIDAVAEQRIVLPVADTRADPPALDNGLLDLEMVEGRMPASASGTEPPPEAATSPASSRA